MSFNRVHVIGGGLAGSEAAFLLANQGIHITLHEMRPKKLTAAHKSANFAELVCSNSFKSKSLTSGPGILKKEMSYLGSLALQAASVSEVPGGQALAVDREVFSKTVTDAIHAHPLIEHSKSEVEHPIAGEINLIATGPLTSEALSQWIVKNSSTDDLYFYDAIAPIVDAASIDMDKAFWLIAMTKVTLKHI